MTERIHILRNAGTILVGQLAVMAFGITDTIVAAHYADTALAALSVGSATYISVHVALMGIVQALLPIWAELQGAKKYTAIGQSVRQALYIVLLTSAVGMVILLNPATLLNWAQVPQHLQAEIHDYLTVVAFGLPASLLFRLFGTLNQGLGRPRSVTLVQVFGLICKIPLSILLVLGIPDIFDPMGLVGCAWATLVVNFAMVAFAILLIRFQNFYKPYAFWRALEAPNFSVLMQFLKLGIPSGLAIGVEVTSFTLMALFIARQGVIASASHQITASLAALLYMVPLSLSIACSARVSYWLGANRIQNVRKALRDGLTLVIISASFLSLILIFFQRDVVLFYTQSPAITELAVALIYWLACYQIADALQVFCVFALRCYKVTVFPLFTYAFTLWGVGLAGGYAVSYGLWTFENIVWLHTNSPITFWQTSTFALLLTVLILFPALWICAYRKAD
ncbi:MAG: MATE family efflux transporter [Burkholderiales bacterium]|jgi:MATE family multidrug resistance protein|nr:MATE family efflux transporter [Burkholderiales bacterium]